MHTQRQEDGPPTGVLLTCPCCGGVSPERHQSRRFLFTEGRLKNIIQNINNYNSVTYFTGTAFSFLKRRQKKENRTENNRNIPHKLKCKTTTPAHPTQLLLSCLPITQCTRTPNNAESIGTRLSASYAQIIGALPLSTH